MSRSNSTVPSQPEPELPLPDKFNSNKRGNVASFKRQFDKLFVLQARRFPDVIVQTTYISVFLEGAAATWYNTLVDNVDPVLTDLELFWSAFETRFAPPLITDELQSRLLRVHQDPTEGINEFNSRFRNLASNSDFNDAALRGIYLQALSPEILQHFYYINPTPPSLEETMLACERIFNLQIAVQRRVAQRTPRHLPQHPRPMQSLPARPSLTQPQALPPPVQNRTSNNSSSPSSTASSSRASMPFRPLTEDEKDYRRRNNLCIYCGANDHVVNVCPVKPKNGSGRN
jgi:hypothetical protein